MKCSGVFITKANKPGNVLKTVCTILVGLIQTQKRVVTSKHPYHGSLLGDTIDAGRLLSADLTALFTNSADTDRVMC